MPTAEHHSDGTRERTPPVGDRYPTVTPFYRFAVFVSGPIVRRLYRLRVEGMEHVPAEGGFVVAANHVSNLDPWPLGIALWPRQLHYMAKSELFKPGLATLLRWAGSFPVRRGEADVEALRAAIGLCRAGRVMAMFPEGTRRAKGLRKKRQPRPHTGSARIATGAGVPLVPAAIRGTDRMSRLGPLRVRFGAPVALDDLDGLDSRAAAQEATRRLWDGIRRLEAELDGEPPGPGA